VTWWQNGPIRWIAAARHEPRAGWHPVETLRVANDPYTIDTPGLAVDARGHALLVWTSFGARLWYSELAAR